MKLGAGTLLVMVVAVVALVFSVWLVGDHAKVNLAAEVRAAQLEQAGQLRAGCARGVARDFEALETNRDLAEFAADAAAARRRDGNVRTARRYEATAARARSREDRIGLRVPSSADKDHVRMFCLALNPKP